MYPEDELIEGNLAQRRQVDDFESADPHEQLRRLYMALLTKQERFDEFKQLLGSYPPEAAAESAEPEEATQIREKLNRRISEWIGGPFEGLAVMQLLLWRAIVVEQRFNVALSPWKESNLY
jgi:hypothetical protein